MKERAGTVGRRGVNGVLRQLKAARPPLHLHLVGHSFGGRLVTAATDGPAGENALGIDTLTLLQAAFSHNGFASKYDGTNDGGFRAVVTGHKVRGPILVTHSVQDRAVGVAYPLASRVSGQDAAALGDENDRFGGIGRNGAQHTPERVVGTLQPTTMPYAFQPGKVFNLNADSIIAEHSDICHNEVAFALLTAIAAS
jgi:pimeloyl-ACP methyl ester carboxylesterase